MIDDTVDQYLQYYPDLVPELNSNYPIAVQQQTNIPYTKLNTKLNKLAKIHR